MSSLDVVLVTGLCLPMAAALYWAFEKAAEQFFFAFGNTVGWPYL
jgi:hypothetical protein